MVRKGVLRFGGFLLAAMVSVSASDQLSGDRARMTAGDGTVVTLEIADTEPKRNRGLMFRESLPESQGMLFVFEQPGFYPFWMKNCRIALDIVWLDRAFKVVSLSESVPPCRLPGCEPPCESDACPTYAPDEGTAASYVVELAAGFAKRHGLKKGQTLAVQLPRR